MHIMDQVQRIDIDSRQPIHHHLKLLNHIFIIQEFSRNRSELRAYLLLSPHIASAIQSIEQALGQISTCPEELHLFARLSC